MAENKISVKDKAVQESLKANVGKYIEVRGIFVSGDPINKLEGEALERDIRFQKETQHRMYINKEPYIKFKIEDVNMQLKDKDAAERLVYQQIFTDSEGKKSLTVETKTKFTIGYRAGDKLIPIKQSALEGRRFAYNQGITVTFEVYQPKEGLCGVGLANIIFDEKPEFYESNFSEDRIGVVEGQNWATEVDDLGLDTGVQEPESAASDEPATEPAAESSGANWDEVWS